MGVKLGISLIAWQNDDLPELTAAFTTEGAMEDAAKIGYSGVERGRRMPDDTETKYFSTASGSILMVREQGEKRGIYYWRNVE